MMLMFVGAVVVVVVVALLAQARSQYRRDEAWERFASVRQLGWSNGQIAGVAGGCTVAIFTEKRGSGRNQYTAAVVRCSLPDVFSASFALERETVFEKVKHLVTGPDHQVGDAELDSTFLLTNVDGGARHVLADRAARAALLSTVERYPAMRIGNGVLQLETGKVPGDEADLSAFLNEALKVATALQRAKQRG
ncbi:MAG: hypothetical protein JNK82_36585 [Myxococcaceae bacterium]|nr:hypothetical protein [Myxococcaceae bacterium]